MRLLRCRLRREDEGSNCRLPCSLPREKLYEFVSRVARRRALAWLRETIRVCTRVFILVHTFNMQAFAHKESLFEPNERGVVHASTRHAHQPRTRAAASYYSTMCSAVAGADRGGEGRGPWPDAQNHDAVAAPTPRARPVAGARRGGVSRLRRARNTIKNKSWALCQLQWVKYYNM